MNKFGEFLYTLRKEKGMTQVDLADKLNVTNKAVSKWETGEAMPETGLLRPIADIFDVTVDELLRGERMRNCEERVDNIRKPVIEGHVFTRGKDDGPESLPDKICGVICATVILGGITAYLLLGAIASMWTPYWVIVPVCALSDGIIGILFGLCNSEKRKEKRIAGKNPYTDAVCGIIFLLCCISYLLVGGLAGLWHPYWVIIVIGMTAVAIIGATGTCIAHKNK